MSPTKQFIYEVLEMLPDDATMEDFMYLLYVQAFNKSMLEDNRMIPREEFDKRLRLWSVSGISPFVFIKA